MIAYLVRRLSDYRAVYVGITATSSRKRWRIHLTKSAQGRPGALYNAIRKLGDASFSVEDVASARSWEDLCEVEKLLIQQHQTFHDLGGYNLTAGGDGFLGARHSQAVRDGMSKRRLGVPRLPETVAKTAAGLRGKKLSPEHLAKLQAGARKRAAEHGPHNKGKPMSDEQREKLRAAWSRRKEKWPNGISDPTAPQRAGEKTKAWWSDPANAEEVIKRVNRLRQVAPTSASDATRLKQSEAAKRRATTAEGQAHLARLHSKPIPKVPKETRSEMTRRAEAARTPEDKKAIATKRWETRRRNAAKATR